MLVENIRQNFKQERYKMLVQKQKNLPYIGIFKTQSGEELIAKVVEETMIAFTIEKPLCMVMGERGLQFAPFLMMADMEKPITLPKPMISATPQFSIEEQYESVTSKIVVPKKSSIIS
jgi:hypothetical protein